MIAIVDLAYKIASWVMAAWILYRVIPAHRYHFWIRRDAALTVLWLSAAWPIMRAAYNLWRLLYFGGPIDHLSVGAWGSRVVAFTGSVLTIAAIEILLHSATRERSPR